MKNSGIQWTTHTFNPWIGCQRVSPGCENCYAEALDNRWRPGNTRWGPKAPRTRTSPAYWKQPFVWNDEAKAAGRRDRVFCASLADVFEDRAELVPWRLELFRIIAQTSHLDWLLLTKRPENIARLWPEKRYGPNAKQWPNIWLGTTVEDQQRADERIPRLLSAPAAVHFLSVEPLIESVSLWVPGVGSRLEWNVDSSSRVDWVIVGGESGAGARGFDIAWAFDLKQQCETAGVAFFMKQLGARAYVGNSQPDSARGPWKSAGHKGDDFDEFPQALRRREFPKSVSAS